MTQLKTRSRDPLPNQYCMRLPSTTQTKIDGILTTTRMSAIIPTAIRLCEGAYAVIAVSANAQAFGLTHWNRAAWIQLNGRPPGLRRTGSVGSRYLPGEPGQVCNTEPAQHFVTHRIGFEYLYHTDPDDYDHDAKPDRNTEEMG